MTPVIVPTIFTARDQVSGRVARMGRNIEEMNNRISRAGQTAFKVGRNAGMVGLAIAAPLILAGREVVSFEDKMADIAKTTGLKGKELTKFGDDLLDMSNNTRSSIDELLTIGEIGGRLGIAQKDLRSFTQEADKFSVALGGDFSGGVESAITQVGKMTTLFKDTKDLDIGQALKEAGSGLNALSSKGVNVEGLSDFALRVGGLPEAMRPTMAATNALGATLQKSGIDAQIASSGFSMFTSIAASNLPAFAKEMGRSTEYARNLINTDTAGFFAEFAEKMKGVPADQMALKLKKLGLNSLEVKKAVGAMAASTELYGKMLTISTDEQKRGVSIGNEYNVKNNTTAAQMAKLKNIAQSLMITIGNALLPVINDLAEAVVPYIKSAAEWVKNNKGLVSTIVKVAAGVGTASLAISGLSFAVGVAQKAMALFGSISTLSLGPIGLIVAAVGAATVAYSYLSAEMNRFKTDQELADDVTKRALENTIDQRLEVMQLFKAMQKAKEGSAEYVGALQKIEEMQPGITAKYDLQRKSVEALSAAEKDLTANIMKRALEEAKAELAKEGMKKALETQAEGVTFSDKVVSFMLRLDGRLTGNKKMAGISAEDILNQRVNAEMRQAEQIANLDMGGSADVVSGSADNATNMVKDINLVVNGENMGTLGELYGKKTSVQPANFMPSLGSTR